MSQGTRTRQIAAYVIFDAPLSMLSDSPSNYLDEEECTDFIVEIPVCWDDTVPLDGKIGHYTVVARKKDRDWYIAAMTDWEPRDLLIDVSEFLDLGKGYEIEVFEDGLNADRVATDYRRSIGPLPSNGILKPSLAPGGAYVAKIRAL